MRAIVLFILAGLGFGIFDLGIPSLPNVAFTQLHLGGGGAMNNIQAWSDGTKTVTSDTAGAYICYQCVNLTSKWQQVVLYSAVAGATIFGNPDGYGIYNFFVAPGNTKHGYLYYYGKVYYSTNLNTCATDGCPGLTWTASDLAPGNFGIGDEKFSGPYGAADPANDNIAYISTPVNTTGGVTAGMYKTTNGGVNFTLVSAVGNGALYTGPNGDNGNGGSMVCFDPKSSVVGGVTQGIYIFTNGGTSGGLWASSNGGSTWTLTSSGPTKDVHIVCDQNGAVWVTDNQTARTPGNHNLWKYSCASPPCGSAGTWTNITTDDAVGGATNLTIMVDPSTSGGTTKIVVATNSGDQTNQSTDNGNTWTGVSGNYATIRSQNTGSNPVPWLVATDQVNFSTGGEVFDPSQCPNSANCVLYQADGIGVWYNVGAVWPHLSFVEQTNGIENLTSGQTISPWGAHSHLVWTGLDRGFFQLPDPTVYAKIQGSGTGFNCGSGQISPAYGTQWAGGSDGQNGSLIISALIGGCGIFGYSTANGFGSVVTISVASPAVVTCTGCNLAAGQGVTFTGNGGTAALPTGLTAFYSGLIPANGAAYYVTNDGSLTANSFHVSDTQAHALAGTGQINTTGAGNGLQITLSTFIPFADNTPLTNGAFQGGCGAVNNGSGFPNFDVVWFNTRDQDGPWYSTNGGGSWTNLNSYFHTNFGVPLANTTSNGWGSGNGPFGTNWHCDSDKVNVNNFVVYNSGVSGGCDQTKAFEGFYHSSDGGATWTQFGHATVDCALGTGKTVRAVPGQAGEYYFSAGLNSSNFSGTWPGAQKLWHITGSGSSITSCNNIVGVTSVDLGAPAPGHSYPAIYVYGSGNGSGITGVWRNIDGTCNTWTQLGSSPQPGNWLDAIYQVVADGNIYGQVYLMTHGSNLVWGRFN